MIQRIQSLFLLCATILLGVAAGFFMVQTLFAPVSTDSAYIAFHEYLPILGFIFPTLLVLAEILSVVCIFQYKHRMKQVQIILAAQISVVLAYVCYLIPFITRSNLSLEVGVPLILPLIAFVLNVAARKAIIHDEQLVRASNRIR